MLSFMIHTVEHSKTKSFVEIRRGYNIFQITNY